MFRRQTAQTPQVMPTDDRAPLGLDREIHFAQHEVDFDTAGKTPVRQVAVEPGVRHPGGKFMVDPVLEGPAVQLGPALEAAPPRQPVDHTHIREVEPGRRGQPALPVP